jgi:hypothetical protein
MATSVLKRLGAVIMALTLSQIVSKSWCVQASQLSSRTMVNDWNQVSSFSALDEFMHYLLFLSVNPARADQVFRS